MNINKMIAEYDGRIMRGMYEPFTYQSICDIIKAAEGTAFAEKYDFVNIALKVGYIAGFRAGRKDGFAAGTKTTAEYFGYEYSEYLAIRKQIKSASRDDRKIIHAFTSEYLNPQTPQKINS